jgi:hypothetical protein
LLSDQIDRATWRNTLVYRVNPDLQVGLEYNPLADDLGPLANWRIARESAAGPAVILGTSSDRIGTPEGRAYYLTLAKAMPLRAGRIISPYFGLLWSEYDDRLLFPAGASIPLGPGMSFHPTYDGHAFHLMASYAWDRFSATAILVRVRDPGMAFTVGF